MALICNSYIFKINNIKRPPAGLFLCLFFCLSPGFGQKSDSYNPIISAIEFQGLQKTKQDILEREIQHQLNMALDSSLAKEDRNRLENLGNQKLFRLTY